MRLVQDSAHNNHLFTLHKRDRGTRATRDRLPPSVRRQRQWRLSGFRRVARRGYAPSRPVNGRTVKRSAIQRASVCHGRAGRRGGAYFGPDYRESIVASLRPRRLCTPSHATPGGRNTIRCPGRRDPRRAMVTSLVRALALHGVAMLRSHLASTLRPGRGVLIRSVSRRLGSVACVREDASPNEVSAKQGKHAGSVPRCQTEPSPPQWHPFRQIAPLTGRRVVGSPPRPPVAGGNTAGLSVALQIGN